MKLSWRTNLDIPGAFDSTGDQYRITPVRSVVMNGVQGWLLLHRVNPKRGVGAYQLVKRCPTLDDAKAAAQAHADEQ